MNIRKQLFALFFAAYSVVTLAGGFQINEHGARAMAMGGAFTALSLDPSAIYFNNAAITGLSGFQLMVGTTMIAPNASFRGPNGPGTVNPSVNESKMVSQKFFPSHFYATYQLCDRLTAGLGFNNPFGLGTKWDENWVGRFVSIEGDVKTFSLNPVVAYKIFDNLSVGVGFQYNMGTVNITKSTVPTSNGVPLPGEMKVVLDGKDNSATGFTAGLQYQPCRDLSVGFSYRGQVQYDFTGTATFSTKDAVLAPKVPGVQDIAATLKSPSQMTFGLAYHAAENLMVSADFQMVNWSSYDSLKVDFKDASMADLASPRMYQNTWIARFGAEYLLNQSISLRGGFLYDKNPVKDEYVDASLPDADRFGFSLGAGYKIASNLSVDFGWLFLRFKERTVTTSTVVNNEKLTNGWYYPEYFNGTYNSSANLFSLSLSYNF